MENSVIWYADEKTIINNKTRSLKKEFITGLDAGILTHGPWISVSAGTYTALISLISDEPSEFLVLILDRAG